MILYPREYINNVTEISYEMLRENDIKGIILDVDNTLIDIDKNMLNGVDEWCNNIKKEGIKFYIVSNSNKKKKVQMVANELDIPYIYFASKPFKRGFLKAQEEMNLPKEKIAVVGDQIFTDVLGANRVGMFSILVDPIKEKDLLDTRIKRPIENFIKKKYKSKK